MNQDNSKSPTPPVQAFKYRQDPKFGHFIPVAANKVPVITNWSEYRPRNSAKIVSKALNVGFALGTHLFVIDLDTYKPGGVGSASAIFAKYPELLYFPCVETKSGGSHLFCALTEEQTFIHKRKTLPKVYPSIDFLKVGNYVMCAGNEGYKWVIDIDWQALPMAPTGLIEELRYDRPKVGMSQLELDHSVITPGELKDILSQLDPNQFNGADHPDGDRSCSWINMMTACAAATGYGDEGGFEVFDQWSRQVDYYSDGKGFLARWKSFKERSNGINIGTLFYFCDRFRVNWKSILGLEPPKSPLELDFDFSGDWLDGADDVAGGKLDPSQIKKQPILSRLASKNPPKIPRSKVLRKMGVNDVTEMLLDVIKEPRSEHDKLVNALSVETKWSVTKLYQLICSLVAVGDSDTDEKLSQKEIGEKIIALLSYMGHGNDPVFSHGQLYVYDGAGCWAYYDVKALKVLIMKHMDKKFGISTNAMYSAIADVVQNLLENDDQYRKDDFFDNAPIGVGFDDGFLRKTENHELQFIIHQANNRLKFKYDFNYRDIGSAPTPLYDAFKKNSIGAENQTLVEQMMGAAILGIGPRLGTCLLIQGAGSNGKSQLLDLFRALSPTGENTSFSLNQLKDPTAVFRLKDTNIICVDEVGSLYRQKMHDGQTFKRFVTGEYIDAKQMYVGYCQIKPRALWVLAGNTPPSFDDMGPGFMRRFAVIRMDNEIEACDKIQKIGERIIKEEFGGVVLAALEAVTKMLKVTGATYDIQPENLCVLQDQDTIKEFMDHYVVRDNGARIERKELIDQYIEYCDTVIGVPAESRQVFIKYIKSNLGIRDRKIQGAYHIFGYKRRVHKK